MSNLLFKIQTLQSAGFRTLIESLKDILTDANIIVNKDGIKLIAMDPSHTILVHLKLDAHEFQEYTCEMDNIKLGINMINFFKLIKTIGNKDILTLMVDKDDSNKLIVLIENSEKNALTKYHINLMDIPDEEIEIPDLMFDSVITMPSSDFQKLCRDMNYISDKVEIKSFNNKLIFSCTGDIGSAEHEIIENDISEGVNFIKKKSDDMTQGVFLLKHLVMFTKCTNLSSQTKLFLKNEYPLIITYKIASLGEIKLCLAPVVNE